MFVAKRPAWRRIEWGTALLLLSNLGLWLATVLHADQLPTFLVFLLGGFTLCLHGSLQHECVHGHPTPWRWLNTLLAWTPVTLWIPYRVYRASHLAHHQSPSLTHPQLDSESFYFERGRWEQLPAWRRWLEQINTALLGRMLVGPWMVWASMWADSLARIRAGESGLLTEWMLHFAGCAGVLWVASVGGLSPAEYMVLMVWPGIALTLQRSYGEHHPGEDQDRCTAIVETGPLLSLLYLNNNLHSVHHAFPGLAWYRVPGAYFADRERWLHRNGNRLFRGYSDLWRRHAFSSRSAVYPLDERPDNAR